MHSILPPSGAGAWRRCALWVTMNQRYPQEDTPESMEGTAAHSCFVDASLAEGSLAPNGTPVTQEMIEGGQLFKQMMVERLPAGAVWHVEEPVAIPRIHPQCFGTPDIWAFSWDTLVLELPDYKFGHEFVDEFENDQLMVYAAGILEKLAAERGRTMSELDQAVKINFTIVQPRCYYKGSPVRTWSVRASDLRGHWNQLAEAAEDSFAQVPTATTGAHCKHCPGRHACPALQQGAYSDAEFAVKSLPVDLSPAVAALELKILERSLDRLTARVEGLRESLLVLGRQGERLPYYRMEQSYGRTTWTLPADQVIAIGELMGADLSKVGVVTPAQAKKLGVDESVIKAYSVTPLGSTKLVPDDTGDARRVFGTSI